MENREGGSSRGREQLGQRVRDMKCPQTHVGMALAWHVPTFPGQRVKELILQSSSLLAKNYLPSAFWGPGAMMRVEAKTEGA